jgi:hypothetical protein
MCPAPLAHLYGDLSLHVLSHTSVLTLMIMTRTKTTKTTTMSKTFGIQWNSASLYISDSDECLSAFHDHGNLKKIIFF